MIIKNQRENNHRWKMFPMELFITRLNVPNAIRKMLNVIQSAPAFVIINARIADGNLKQ